MSYSEIMGSIGVSILLIAFVLNMMKLIKTESLLYSLFNFTGAGIACYASLLIHYFPFVILEGTWAMVSFVSVIRWIRVNY